MDYLLQACDAIDEMHALGFIHGDLKPANLMLTVGLDGPPLVKVVDFGLATAASTSGGLDGPDNGQAATMVGTVPYMAPERFVGSDVDFRADVWSLGVTLYQLLTRRLPFSGGSPLQLRSQIISGGAPRMQLEDAPPGLEAVILKCLQPNREHRCSSVEELAGALVSFGSERALSYLTQIRKRRR